MRKESLKPPPCSASNTEMQADVMAEPRKSDRLSSDCPPPQPPQSKGHNLMKQQQAG